MQTNDADKAEGRRAAFRSWMESRGLSPFAAAKRAGVSPGAIYNFLSGTSDNLSVPVMEKLAEAFGDTVDAILTGSESTYNSVIAVTFRVGGRGEIFQMSSDGDAYIVPRPQGVRGDGVAAAVVDGQGLHPIPPGWLVFFAADETDPVSLIGEMALVRFDGGGPRPVIRTVRRGTAAGLFTLQSFSGELTEDVTVLAAHRVFSFAAPGAGAEA